MPIQRDINIAGKIVRVTAMQGPTPESSWKAYGNLFKGVSMNGYGPTADDAVADWERRATARLERSQFEVKAPAFGREGAVYVKMSNHEAERFKRWAASEQRASVNRSSEMFYTTTRQRLSFPASYDVTEAQALVDEWADIEHLAAVDTAEREREAEARQQTGQDDKQ